jgi:hypothetical protein
MKKCVALARVSSREQEREGFSLAVQADALKRYAVSAGGEIVRLFRIAETARKTDARKAFKKLIADQVDQDTFASKHTELRDRLSSIKLQVDLLDRSHDENAEIAVKVFELSQTLRDQWVSADYATKRRLLEIVCLNCTLDGASVVPTTRKPFDVLVEGLYSETSRGERI